MATRIIWQNPGDPNDTIEFNDDVPTSSFYRFRIDTGFELTLTREASASRVSLKLGGGTHAGVVSLNGNGEVWSNGDLTLWVDKDGGANNKLYVRNSSGLAILTVDEAGVVSALDEYRYATAKSRKRTFGPFGATTWFTSSVPTGEPIVYQEVPPAPLKPDIYLRAKDLTYSRTVAVLPVHLPNAAVVKVVELSYRKIQQAAGKQRYMDCRLIRSPRFASSIERLLQTIDDFGLIVSNADPTNEFGTKSRILPPTPSLYEVIDNDNYYYGVYINIVNEDTTLGGADGIGFCAYRISYDARGPGDD